MPIKGWAELGEGRVGLQQPSSSAIQSGVEQFCLKTYLIPEPLCVCSRVLSTGIKGREAMGHKLWQGKCQLDVRKNFPWENG